jgi:hypothetical protein
MIEVVPTIKGTGEDHEQDYGNWTGSGKERFSPGVL